MGIGQLAGISNWIKNKLESLTNKVDKNQTDISDNTNAITQLNSDLDTLKTYYTLNNWSVEGIQAGSYASGVQRFQDDGIKHVKEFIFVMYAPHDNENGYEYISIKTPFDEMEDNYYAAYTSKGTIQIYYSRTYGIVDLREVPMILKNILYRKP